MDEKEMKRLMDHFDDRITKMYAANDKVSPLLAETNRELRLLRNELQENTFITKQNNNAIMEQKVINDRTQNEIYELKQGNIKRDSQIAYNTSRVDAVYDAKNRVTWGILGTFGISAFGVVTWLFNKLN
jgi:hypothetical protein